MSHDHDHDHEPEEKDDDEHIDISGTYVAREGIGD